MESAPHAQQKLFIDLGTEIQVYDLLRRASKNRKSRVPIRKNNG